MPLLDVTEVLTDPDFAEFNLVCVRNTQKIDDNGRAYNVPRTFPFVGVVTSAGGVELQRLAEAERNKQTISIITRFRLAAGDDTRNADVVTWACKQYTVRTTDDYSHYGRGFIQAIAVLLPLHG